MNQRQIQHLAIILVALIVMGALLFLSGTLSSVELKAGAGQSVGTISDRLLIEPPDLTLPPSVWDIFRIFLWGSLLVSALYTLISPEGRRDFKTVIRRSPVPFIVMLIIVQTVIGIARNASNQYTLGESGGFTTTSEVAELEQQLETIAYESEPPPGLTTFLSILFMTGVVAWAYTRWRRRPSPPQSPSPFPELLQQAHRAIAELRQGDQLDDAILRCYREMSQTVALQRGVHRGKGVTPREFEVELERIGIPGPAVKRLTRLFEQVRYGGYMPGRRDQLEAIDSLEIIVDACHQFQQEKR